MKLMRSDYLRGLAAAALALVGLAGAGVAQARSDVYWSVGINAAPGVTLGLGNTSPVYMAPQPVYMAPQPVYVQPAPVYYMPPAPVYYGRPAPVYYGTGVYVRPARGYYRHGHRHHHDRHRR